MHINNLPKIIYVTYNKEGFFQSTILLKTTNGIIPYKYGKADYISFYPFLAKQLIEGKILYVDYNCGYVGIKKTEGPYCENQVFESEYEGINVDFNELLIRINDSIRNEKKTPRKLVKIGESYKQHYQV